ncbi:hypothetical protein RB213_001138, partial [Colletotrichum asianum]
MHGFNYNVPRVLAVLLPFRYNRVYNARGFFLMTTDRHLLCTYKRKHTLPLPGNLQLHDQSLLMIIISNMEPPASSSHGVRYTSEEIEGFWTRTGNELQRSVMEKAASTSLNSIELPWQRTRKKFLEGSRRFTFSEAKPDDVSALHASDLDALDRLIDERIKTASSLEKSHSSDPRISKRAGRRLCDFLVGFRGYCQAYSGVVQLMGGLDQSFVTGALQALGLFMVVAANKVETELALYSTIQTLKSEYSRIQKLVGIYSNSSVLKKCVATVYRLGIEFMQEATVYYSRSSSMRIWHVVVRPPQLDLERKISDLRSAVEELVKERDMEAHLRLDRVESKIDAGLEQTKNERTNARLDKTRSSLGLPPNNVSTQLQDFVSLLDEEFSHLKRIPPFRAEDLTGQGAFNIWVAETAQTKRSTFLLVHGQTIAPWDTALAWTSQASVEAVRLLEEKQAVVSWHFCEPDNKHEVDIGGVCRPIPAAALVLLSLGYRLLELTSIGREALGSSNTPDFEFQLQKILGTAQSSREKIDARRTGIGNVTLKD